LEIEFCTEYRLVFPIFAVSDKTKWEVIFSPGSVFESLATTFFFLEMDMPQIDVGLVIEI
jgi:hypothetical protein